MYARQPDDDEKRIEALVENAGKNGYRNFRILKGGTSTEIGVIRRGHVLFIAPAGTNPLDIQDILKDADFPFRHAPLGGMAHGGFASALDQHNSYVYNGKTPANSLLKRGQKSRTLYEEITTLVNEHIIKHGAQAQIVITGHSLGGAIAEDLACRFARDGKADYVRAVVTFGQPRYGDLEAAGRYHQIFHDRAIRIVNSADPITRLSPRRVGQLMGEAFSFGVKALKINGSDYFTVEPSEHTQSLSPLSQFVFPVDGMAIVPPYSPPLKSSPEPVQKNDPPCGLTCAVKGLFSDAYEAFISAASIGDHRMRHYRAKLETMLARAEEQKREGDRAGGAFTLRLDAARQMPSVIAP